MIGNPHPNPLEVVEAAVSVVELAWKAVDSHRDHSVQDAAWEDGVKLEGELAHERSENHRLKAALEECQRALQELRSSQRGTSGAAEVPRALSSTLCVEDCPSDLYDQLQRKVDSPIFLERLKELQAGVTTGSSMLVAKNGEDMMVNVDPEDPSWWLWITDDLFTGEEKEESDGLGNDSYIIVNQDDVIEGVAVFIAKLIASNPNAKKMTPMELQEVVSKSFTRMETMGRLRKLWAAAKFLYVFASWTTAAVKLYKSPLILGAILKAVSLSGRVIVRILT